MRGRQIENAGTTIICILLTPNFSWKLHVAEKIPILKFVVLSNWNKVIRNKSIKHSVKLRVLKYCSVYSL